MWLQGFEKHATKYVYSNVNILGNMDALDGRLSTLKINNTIKKLGIEYSFRRFRLKSTIYNCHIFPIYTSMYFIVFSLNSISYNYSLKINITN